jgi:hypothetical protein
LAEAEKNAAGLNITLTQSGSSTQYFHPPMLNALVNHASDFELCCGEIN